MFPGIQSQSQGIASASAPLIERVDTKTYLGYQSGNFNVAFNITPSEGDLILVLCAGVGSGAPAAPTISGYTEIFRKTSGNTKYSAYYLLVGPTPPTSVTVSAQDPSQQAVVVAIYRGAGASQLGVTDIDNPISNPDAVEGYEKAAINPSVSGALLIDIAVTYTVTNSANWFNDDSETNIVAIIGNTNDGALGSASFLSIGMWEKFNCTTAVSARLYKHLHTNNFGLNYSTLIINPS